MESKAYERSHHALALSGASPELVAQQFTGGQHYTPLGGTTRFTQHDGEPLVVTATRQASEQTLRVRYVAGVWPLQQYVVEAARGRLQTLGVAWDSRATREGGAAWFHVYGQKGLSPQDPLFFEAATQNWNHMCADCHSTFVERRYTSGSDSFDTRWSELSVGCEACHGPGADHVRSARDNPTGPVEHFPARLRPSQPWLPSSTGSPVPHARDDIQLEVCAPCHSRRKPLREGFQAGEPLLDSFEPELLWPGRYHADGQVEGEVFEWGSFLQSRMHQAGVTCSDCHDPHSGQTYAEGDALCVRCHQAGKFLGPQHSHHQGPGAPLCVDCHMPSSTFMQIDARRDHSIRVPRPDYSVEYGTPNACNACHTNKSAAWAADAAAGWSGGSRRGHFAAALGADRKGSLEAARLLRALASDLAAPTIARATALERLRGYPAEATFAAQRAALSSSDPLVVYGAVLGMGQLPWPQRLAVLLPALEHKARAVRVAAGRALAGAAREGLPSRAKPALERAFREVRESFIVNGSRAETHVERGAFELALGEFAAAEAALLAALRLEPCLVEAHLNLADLARQRGDEAAAESAIVSALRCGPQNAGAHHALGLWYVRARKPDLARKSLERAVQLDPADARFAYVLAVALAGGDSLGKAVHVLERSLEGHPNDVNSLAALAGYYAKLGQQERAARVQARLTELLRE